MIISEDLYQQIIRCMPISCVDLLVTRETGELLMIRRGKPPAMNQWWFPGGRVHYGELREQAARRKLLEECGLTTEHMREMGTYDVILDDGPRHPISHAISTVYQMVVAEADVRLDSTSTECAWRPVQAWIGQLTNEFLLSVLRLYSKPLQSKR